MLINNAGIIGPQAQSIKNVDYSGWADTLAVNTLAPLRVSLAILPNLRLATNPKILTISSMMGALNREGTGHYAYRSSKAAVNKVMQVLACDLKEEGIISTLIHPGWVQTDMGGANADISVEESAQGIFKVAVNLKMENSGKFFQWTGEEHPW